MADKKLKGVNLNDPYNYWSKLAIWRKFATYNKEVVKCDECTRGNAHKTVLLEDGRHICWYSWIKKGASYGPVIAKTSSMVDFVKEKKQPQSEPYKKPLNSSEEEELDAALGEVDSMLEETGDINELTKLANGVFIRHEVVNKDIKPHPPIPQKELPKAKVETAKPIAPKVEKTPQPKKVVKPVKVSQPKPKSKVQTSKPKNIKKTPKVTVENTGPRKILTVDKLNKFFVKSGKIVKVLDDINFDVYENDFFGIIGESGSGKSTTGKCVIRLYPTSSGTITFDDQIINQHKMSKKSKFWLTQNMSMIFQDPMSSLNPRKNVLSLIAEPLDINGTIKRETKEFIEKCAKVNPYFQNTFRYQDFLLTRQILVPFYKENIKLFNESSINIWTTRLDANKPDSILNILESLETKFKKSIKAMNQFNQSIYDLIDQNYKKFETRELHETENRYYETENKFLEESKFLKKPKAFYKLDDKLKDKEAELKELKDSFKSKYLVENKTRLDSIKSSIVSEMKALKQDYLLTDSLTDYTFSYTSYLILKDTLHALNGLERNICIELEDIESFSKMVLSKIESKYAKLMEDISKISILNKQLDSYSLKNTDETVISKTFKEYEALYKRIHEQTEALKKTNFTEELAGVANTIEKLNKRSETINANHEIKVAFYQEEILVLKEEIKKTLESHEKKETSLDFEKSLTDFEAAKLSRDIFIQEDNAEFASQSMPYINALKREVKSLDNAFYKSWIELKKASQKMADKLAETVSPDDKKSPEAILVKRNIENKLQIIDAINFEYMNLLEEVALFRNLRNRNKIVLNVFYKQLYTFITRQYVYKSLEEVGLKSEHAYRYPHEFSGGQRQRIVIARALISKPKLIIADEPISALDVSIQAQVINIMRDLAKKRGITFLFIAHDLSMVRYVSNRMIIMHKGRIVEKGDTDHIFKNPVHPYTKSLLKASPELSKIHVDLASFSSVMDYDSDYSNTNQPSYFSVSDKHEHFVFATKEQLEKWKK
ncbi:MAG: ATP-binding cassette domain-containing protein [Mycoplasma sp.]